jgi:heat shock protein HslJ
MVSLDRLVGLAVAAVLVGTLAACGGDESSGGSEPPATDTSSPTESASQSASESASESASPSLSPAVLANTYVSTEVTGHDLVEGTQIRLIFEEGNLSVEAGCNTMFAPYELTDESLTWTDTPAQTMKACSDELTAQDQWLVELFTRGVGAAADGPALTLTSDDVTIVLDRAPEADLQELFGTTWSAVATIADGKTSRIPRVVRTPRVVLGKNGLGRLDTGCNSGRTTVTADDTSITFGHPAVTRIRCQEPARTIEQRVLEVVNGRSDYVVFDGSVLIVVKGDHGLVFQVS